MNRNCVLTGLTIRPGDRCVVIPVTADSRLIHNHKEITHLNSPDQLWEPCCFSVRGTYDGEGLTDIQHDDTVQMLEQRYRMDIRQIMDMIINMGKSPYTKDSCYGPLTGLEEEFNSFDWDGALTGSHFVLHNGKYEYSGTSVTVRKKNGGFFARAEITDADGYVKTCLYEEWQLGRFFEDYHRLTGNRSGFTDADRISDFLELSKTAAMFLLADAYDEFALVYDKNISTAGLQLTPYLLAHNGFEQTENGMWERTVCGSTVRTDTACTVGQLELRYEQITGRKARLVNDYPEYCAINIQGIAGGNQPAQDAAVRLEMPSIMRDYSMLDTVCGQALCKGKCAYGLAELMRLQTAMEELNKTWMPSYEYAHDGTEYMERLNAITMSMLQTKTK